MFAFDSLPRVAALRPEFSCWLCLDLTAALLRISARGYYSQARALFDEVMQVALPALAPYRRARPRTTRVHTTQQGAPHHLLAALVRMAPAGSPAETQLQADLLEQVSSTHLRNQ